MVEYEPDRALRDTEQVPLLAEAASRASCAARVLPYAPDAWYDPKSVKVGYEISFTRHFYKPQPLRSRSAIRADLMALERENEAVLATIVGGPIANDLCPETLPCPTSPPASRGSAAHERTGKRRDRLFAYSQHLAILREGTEVD